MKIVSGGVRYAQSLKTCALLVALSFAGPLTAQDASTRHFDDVRGNPAREAEPSSLICPIDPPETESRSCGRPSCVVEIKESTPLMRQVLKEAVLRSHTEVRLGPNVELDFSNLNASFFPIYLTRCVTLQSVNSFETPPTSARPGNVARSETGSPGSIGDLEAERERRVGSARTPKSLGPVLTFGSNHPGTDPPATFLEVRCFPGNIPNDGVRIRGFRLIGPSFGQQTTNESGITVNTCIDVEVSNMEIAGWGGAGITVLDNDPVLDIPEGCVRVGSPHTGSRPHPRPLSQAFRCPPGKQVTRLPYPGPYGRMTQASQVRIFNNYIHHNQHPSDGTSAAGYGVDVGYGAYAQITENVFDQNRHAIVGSGQSGGYDAKRNLILKGGGYHTSFRDTHIVDVHGDDNCGPSGLVSSHVWNCGNAGYQFSFEENAFQYVRDNAIKIRGKPRHRAYIANNVFPHEGLEDDWGDDAIHLQTTTNVEIGPGNLIDRDSFGKYEVCDFDGDGIDDLFLATGKTWWYSSMGEFQWSYLGRKRQSGAEIQFGYFNADQRCDVMTESDGRWLISSGGYGDWESLGAFDTALAQARFGRFDLADVDRRPGATKRTTHAFRRLTDGQWQLTPLTSPDWQNAGSSGLPLSKLRFGDFTGDGVTDVLAVIGGRWQISSGANRPWRILNETLGDAVERLYVVDLDHNNVDEILKFQPMTETREDPCPEEEVADCLTTIDRGWRVSWNGSSTWERLMSLVVVRLWEAKKFFYAPSAKFVGRFGLAPGGGTLLVDPNRVGRFYSPGEGAWPEWRSSFPY